MGREAYRSVYGDLTKLKDDSLLKDPAAGTDDDDELFQLLLAMSDWTDHYCNRHFYPRTQTLRLDGSGSPRLLVPDLVSLDTVKEDPNGEGSFEDVWAATDYLLEPYNASPSTHWGVPYSAVRVRIGGRRSCFTAGEQRYEVSGTWGYRQFKETGGATLDGAAAEADGALNVTDGTQFQIGQTLMAGTEQMLVTGIEDNIMTVTRGLNGTVSSGHASGAGVFILRWPRRWNGPHLSRRPASGHAPPTSNPSSSTRNWTRTSGCYWSLTGNWRREGRMARCLAPRAAPPRTPDPSDPHTQPPHIPTQCRKPQKPPLVTSPCPPGYTDVTNLNPWREGITMSWDFELVAGPLGGTTEGPVWNGEALLYTHIPGSRIMRYDPRTGDNTEFFTGTSNTNGLCFDAQGNLYGCQSGGRRIVRFEKDRSTISSLPRRLDGHQHNNPNDLAVDKQGRIWFTDPFNGSAGDQELDHMSVLRLDPQGNGRWGLNRATFDVSRPNGVLISRDQKILYVAQSDYSEDQPRQLRAYPINDDGSLGSYTTIHTFGIDHRGVHRGVDGMTLDVDGNIVACAGFEESGPGPMIYVFSPTGRVLETHPMRVDRPTNCCFGDADMRSLYVTTGGGHLFRARTDRTGWIMWP